MLCVISVSEGSACRVRYLAETGTQPEYSNRTSARLPPDGRLRSFFPLHISSIVHRLSPFLSPPSFAHRFTTHASLQHHHCQTKDAT